MENTKKKNKNIFEGYFRRMKFQKHQRDKDRRMLSSN